MTRPPLPAAAVRPRRREQAPVVLVYYGPVPSPNQVLAMGLRERMQRKRTMREGAFYVSMTAIRKGLAEQVFGPADVNFHAVRKGLLDPSINLPASLKWIQDGLHTCCHRPPHASRLTCPDLVLPLGDGPKSPYRFTFSQEIGTPECTRITITPKEDVQ